jgi:hypothetical protein
LRPLKSEKKDDVGIPIPKVDDLVPSVTLLSEEIELKRIEANAIAKQNANRSTQEAKEIAQVISCGLRKFAF